MRLPASTFSRGVFAEFKKQFPNVQLLVDRAYGTRIVQAVLDNLADFGITQLPVQEKKLQVVKIHSDEIKLLVPARHPLASHDEWSPEDLVGEQILLPKGGTTRARSEFWLDPVQDELNVSMELDSTEMIKRFVMAGLGYRFWRVRIAGKRWRTEIWLVCRLALSRWSAGSVLSIARTKLFRKRR